MKSAKELRIVFMGTPEFATESLKALVEGGYNVVAVITAPDKPAGRGMELQQSDVKKYAASKGLRILQPEKLRNKTFLQELKNLDADLQIVVAFRMLPEAVWNMPPMGTINVHASLLPQYRGAAPINWAVINGETETGVTTFKLQHEIDTGNILLQHKIPIVPDENVGSVYERLKTAGASLLIKTVESLATAEIQEQPQNHVDPSLLKHAPKIFTETAQIDFSKSANEVVNLIRGLSPYPCAFTQLQGKKMKIFKASAEQASTGDKKQGDFITDQKTYLKFIASDGYISAEELQLEGKKKMKTEEFLRGYRFQ